jgi:cobalt-zinc-cadmium efflux system outer membrane protein
MFNRVSSALLLLPMLLVTTASMAQPWTLASSVRQAMSAAPELQQSTAEIAARQQDIKMSAMWPDPSIEFRVDNKLGKDDNSGGFDLTDVTISQPIPVSRIKYQQSVAQAKLKAEELSRNHQSLLLQTRVAKVFHELQFASSQYSLAEKRLLMADELSRKTRKNSRGVVVRYLTSLETMRLDIIREEAHQALTNAEGKYQEARNEFVKLLGLDTDAEISVSELQPISVLPDINHLSVLQENHAQLASQQQQLQAAKHEIDVARSSQMADPTISLSRSRDTFGSGREDVYGVMFNIQIPIHDRKDTAVSKAGYKASQQRIELQRLKRELQINLKRSFTHLNHVVEQAADYDGKVLQRASKMLALTDRGFTSGELSILSLVDANNTYFQAQLRYLELLYQAWTELADVKLYAGQMMADTDAQALGMTQGGL